MLTIIPESFNKTFFCGKQEKQLITINQRIFQIMKIIFVSSGTVQIQTMITINRNPIIL